MGGHGDYTLGHVSARAADGDHVLMKPNGLGLEEVRARATCWSSISRARGWPGTGPIHLEYVLHTEIYKARPDVGAVVHTHPPYATAFGATDAKLELLNHDAVLFREGLAYFDDTAELIVRPEQGAAVAAALGDKRVVVMRGHGVIVTGKTVPWAAMPRSRWSGCCRSSRSPARSAISCRCRLRWRSGSTQTNTATSIIGNYWNYLVRQVRRPASRTGCRVG